MVGFIYSAGVGDETIGILGSRHQTTFSKFGWRRRFCEPDTGQRRTFSIRETMHSMGFKDSIALVAILLITVPYLCHGHGNHGQKETEAHGGRSPHERFQDAHYKNGRHDEHMDHQAILGKAISALIFWPMSVFWSCFQVRKRLRKNSINWRLKNPKSDSESWPKRWI